jgi:hypothetical protein
MAKAVALSEASVRRIWHAHGLKPHLLESFKVRLYSRIYVSFR